MQFLSKLEKSKNYWFLLFISVIFFFLRFPSLFEPYWYGDEGIYYAIGNALNNGQSLYVDIFDNKPPFLYFLYAFLNSDQFLIRSLSLIFGLLSIIMFFILTKNIVHRSKHRFIITSLFAILFGLPLIEGNIANAENFMLLYSISSALLIFKSLNEEALKIKKYLLFLAGLGLGISFLFKVVGVFDFIAFLLFLFFVNSNDKFLDLFKNAIKNIKNHYHYFLGFIIPLAIIFIYFLIIGTLSEFINAVFFSNINYVEIENKFIISQGLLAIKLIILLIVLLFIYLKKHLLSKGELFTYLWLSLSIFSAFFSNRPYTHYVLIILPSLCLLLGLILLKNKHLKFNLLITGICLILLTQFTYFYKTIFYYQNFLLYITNNKSTQDYQKFFDPITKIDYEITSYINARAEKNDNIFVWGNNAQLYHMTNKLPLSKYIVAYHMTYYEQALRQTFTDVQKSNPRYIIIMPNVVRYPFSLLGYEQKINFGGADIYEKLSY